jgi:hypothetical protein
MHTHAQTHALPHTFTNTLTQRHARTKVSRAVSELETARVTNGCLARGSLYDRKSTWSWVWRWGVTISKHSPPPHSVALTNSKHSLPPHSVAFWRHSCLRLQISRTCFQMQNSSTCLHMPSAVLALTTHHSPIQDSIGVRHSLWHL